MRMQENISIQQVFVWATKLHGRCSAYLGTTTWREKSDDGFDHLFPILIQIRRWGMLSKSNYLVIILSKDTVWHVHDVFHEELLSQCISWRTLKSRYCDYNSEVTVLVFHGVFHYLLQINRLDHFHGLYEEVEGIGFMCNTWESLRSFSWFIPRGWCYWVYVQYLELSRID